MKYFLIVLSIVTLLIPQAGAEIVVLDSPHQITPSEADNLEWEIVELNSTNKKLVVKWRWRDSGSRVLMDVGSDRYGWNTWTCENIEVPGENSECIDEGVPNECCTGYQEGSCDDMLDTCFSDIFGFEIRQQDVGTNIGIGLRTLIWNRWKQEELPNNNGTFQ
jgi:hypothetical protein